MMSKRIASFTVSVALALAAGFAPAALAQDVQPRFDLSDPQGGPFPADQFTVPDGTQLTGLRIDLSRPESLCNARPSDCNDIAVLNQLDGFNLQPRLSIPFTGPIDPATVSSDTVFLYKLRCLVASCPGDSQVGISQVVWDPDTNTLYAKADQVLDQDARYLLVVTNGIRVPNGDRIESDQFHDGLHSGTAYTDQLLSAVNGLKAVGIPPGSVAAASIFTTESATAVMEKIRDQLAAAPAPTPADFVIGTNGERTVFPLADVASIVWKRQDTTAPSFTTVPVRMASLRIVPGAIGTIAFGKYSSPDYENADGVIPAVGTKTGVPAVQATNDIYFNLFLPAGPEPPGGWPVVIAGHGASANKNTGNVPVSVAAKLAQHGLATIAINAVGHGGGPLGTLTVTNTDGTAVTLPEGGRNIDRNGDGTFAQQGGSLPEALYTRPDRPDAIVFTRDGFRQTAVDLMQLARVIQVGIDVNGDGTPDLDPNRIYYFGQSLGGIYGTLFAALEPSARASVLGEPGGSFTDVARLEPVGPGRTFLGQLLERAPSLLNRAPGTDPINPDNPLAFDENLPPRCPEPCTNTMPGAIAIQDKLEQIDWAQQSGDPIAYAPHLRKQPLDGVPARPVLITFGQGDPVIPTTTAGNLLRAGDLADRTIYFRTLDAYAQVQSTPPSAAQLHEWLVSISGPNISGPGGCFALAGQESVATFLASDGTTTLDPDTVIDPQCPSPFFETPFTGTLP
jgi:dienelactone hydrolase